MLRLANDDDYLFAGEPRDVLRADSPPGRAVIDGHELQIAVLGGDANVAIQARELGDLAAAITRRGLTPAPPVAATPEHVSREDLVFPPGLVPIGLGTVDLETFAIEPHGAFLLAGPPGSGRSTALAGIGASARESAPNAKLVHIAPRRSPIARLECWSSSVAGVEEVRAFAAECADAIEKGARPALFFESLTEFTASDAESAIDRLVRVAIREECLVIGESETSTWSQAWTLAAPFKAGRRGLLLWPGDMDGDSLLGTSLGRFKRSEMPPGRGFYVVAGAARLCQVVLP